MTRYAPRIENLPEPTYGIETRADAVEILGYDDPKLATKYLLSRARMIVKETPAWERN